MIVTKDEMIDIKKHTSSLLIENAHVEEIKDS